MQKLKHVLSFLFLFQFFLGFSQQQEKFVIDSLPYEARYAKLKGLYIKRIETESYKSAQKIQMAYSDKIKPEGSDMQEYIKLGSLEWAKANIYKTEFGTAEQAEKEWKAVEEALQKDIKENWDYHKYFAICIAAGFYTIDKDIEAEVKQEYPEKFPKREYKKKESHLPKLPGATP